jgi:hypothetical protein
VQERYDEKLDEWIEESKAALQVGQSFDTWDWIDRNSCVRFSCIWSEKICSQEEIIKLLASDDTADGKEDSFLTPVKDDRGCWTGKLTAQKAGMYYLYYVSYNYLEETYDNYFGCLTVEVME